MANSQLSLVRYAPGVEARDYGLRWYQHEAKEAVERELESTRGTLVVMATGLGKTTLFGAIAGDWPGDVLVLAHRDELVQQAALRLEAMTGETVEVEQGPMHASANARIVVASVQTMMRESRLSGFARDRFGLIIVDEVHHYVSPSFRRPLDYFTNAKVLGVTATPDRADGHALGKIVDSVAYSLDIVDGIEGGYLVPLVGQQVVLGQINLSGIKTQAGDLVAGQLDEEIVKACGAIVKRTLELYPDRKGPVFFPGVKSADLATRLFNAARPGCAEFVSGKTEDDERRDIMRRVKSGRVQYLCNVGIATEGFDWPDANIVVLGRPTKSRSLYTQMVGRGTRVLPGLVEGFAGRDGAPARRAAIAGSEKRDCVILDFTGEAGKHSLVGPEDVLGGRYTDAERDLAKKKRRERRGAMNALEALEEARRELAAAAKALKVRVESTVSAFDPFALYGINREAVRATAMRFGFVEATQGQRDLLKKRGFDADVLAGLSKQEASKLISTEFIRAEKGLATMNQMKALKRHGVSFPVNISKARASSALDYLASCRWRGWDPQRMAEITRG